MKTFWPRWRLTWTADFAFRSGLRGPDRPAPAGLDDAAPATGTGATGLWRHGLALRHADHAGVGTLELHDAHAPAGAAGASPWARNAAGAAPGQAVRAAAGQPAQAPRSRRRAVAVPAVQAPLPPDSDDCPICARELHTPPSTWVLLRLWRFARPYRRQLLAGFLLTLASTAATLVPPYLTMPLMDNVLIPFQNGQQIDRWLVRAVPGRPARRRRCWPGCWAGRAPTCWRWCPSASAPTCAPPPTSIC